MIHRIGETDILRGETDDADARRPDRDRHPGLPRLPRAAIHGLTDLFVEASRISRETGVAAAQVLRVTHWRIVLDGSPMQQVTVLALPDGKLMTESAPSFCGAR